MSSQHLSPDRVHRHVEVSVKAALGRSVTPRAQPELVPLAASVRCSIAASQVAELNTAVPGAVLIVHVDTSLTGVSHGQLVKAEALPMLAMPCT